MRGGFTGVEGARERAQVFSHHGRALSFYTPTLKGGRSEKKWEKVKRKPVRWQKTTIAHDFHQKRVELTVCQTWFREGGQPVTEWFHNSLK